jgi:predicted nucleotidyltransferase
MKFFPDINVFENTQLSQTPKITDQTQFLTESVEKDLNISQNILNSFNIQTKLNPEIWQDDKLNKEVRKNLLKIAIDLVEELKQPEIKIKDVLFVGSLANYNWSKYSDVDLHILIDFSKFKEDEEFIKKFFDAQKDLYNQKHDIKIFDFPVEIYFQDVEEKLEASAVYSVKSDKWLEKPEKEKQKLDIPSIKKKAKRIIDQIKDIKKEFDSKNWEQVVKKADNLKNSIKTKRKSGLENGGEYSTENIVYKILRRTDAIEMINTLKTNAYDNIVTVPEDLNEADKYIPYDERPEMRAAAKAGVSNKDVISDEKLYNVMNECSMAKRAVLAYKEAFQKNESSFVANYMGQKMVGRIPDGFRANPDNLHYFDVPEMGDGGFQFKLYRNGNIVGTHVKARGNMDVNPNMHGATDPGYDKNYEDRIKYFTVKAGFQGKYRDAMVYSVFDSPAIDGSIKVRVINYPEIIDFLTKDKGHMQYTADEEN